MNTTTQTQRNPKNWVILDNECGDHYISEVSTLKEARETFTDSHVLRRSGRDYFTEYGMYITHPNYFTQEELDKIPSGEEN